MNVLRVNDRQKELLLEALKIEAELIKNKIFSDDLVGRTCAYNKNDVLFVHEMIEQIMKFNEI